MVKTMIDQRQLYFFQERLFDQLTGHRKSPYHDLR